jgi:dTDP-glucose pyrophosphorylase
MRQAVILAGGKGTRLKDVSGDLPKPMVFVFVNDFWHCIRLQNLVYYCQKLNT